MNDTIEVSWLPFPTNQIPTGWEDHCWVDPVPAIKHISQNRNKSAEYLKCPAFLDYYKNAFVFKSPIDFKIIDNGCLTLESDKICTFRQKSNKKFKTVVVDLQTVFISNEPLLVEQLPASMDDVSTKIRIIPGEFDIGRWLRPVTLSFELINSNEPLCISAGDPLFYFKFRTNKKVVLNKIQETEKIREVVTNCVYQKYKTPSNTLEQNYTIAKNNGWCPFKH